MAGGLARAQFPQGGGELKGDARFVYLRVVALETCQFSWESTICLVRVTAHGTPGPSLCGRDRFAKDGPGWSLGGGWASGPFTPCAACGRVAEERYPGVPVIGVVGGNEWAQRLRVLWLHSRPRRHDPPTTLARCSSCERSDHVWVLERKTGAYSPATLDAEGCVESVTVGLAMFTDQGYIIKQGARLIIALDDIYSGGNPEVVWRALPPGPCTCGAPVVLP